MGLDARRLFFEAGLDPSRIRQPGARYPYNAMQKLWQLCEQSSAADFSFEVGKRWRPTTYHALGYAWLASHSLLDGFERLTRYSALVNDHARCDLRGNGEVFAFEITSSDTAVQLSLDAVLASLVVMCRFLVGDGFSPRRVALSHHAHAASLLIENWLRCPVSYGRAGHSLLVEIDRSQMEMLLASANAELLHMNESLVLEHLARLDTAQVSNRVRREVASRLPSGRVLEADVAGALALGGRTMQRKLAEEGTSFAALLDDTRKELASRYVQDGAMSLSEAAYLLGFSDQANFSRAFRRWYHCAPSVYRKAAVAG